MKQPIKDHPWRKFHFRSQTAEELAEHAVLDMERVRAVCVVHNARSTRTKVRRSKP